MPLKAVAWVAPVALVNRNIQVSLGSYSLHRGPARYRNIVVIQQNRTVYICIMNRPNSSLTLDKARRAQGSSIRAELGERVVRARGTGGV